MNLQWYPGHMTKARRAMEESLKLVDVIVEIRDARLPYASANPDLKKLGQGKKRLLVLNKADLADPAVTAAWEAFFRAGGVEALSVDSRSKNQAERLRKQLDLWAAEKSEKDAKRGIKNRPIRVMVAGIPNVGKSTMINSLAGRASTKTGDKPGVTKGLQWIRLSRSMELMDTPGILWPKFEDETVGLHLALMGAISQDIGYELTFIVAQPIPARANSAFMSITGLPARMKAAEPNATASMTTPARMVFFLPIFEEMIPMGR